MPLVRKLGKGAQSFCTQKLDIGPTTTTCANEKGPYLAHEVTQSSLSYPLEPRGPSITAENVTVLPLGNLETRSWDTQLRSKSGCPAPWLV